MTEKYSRAGAGEPDCEMWPARQQYATHKSARLPPPRCLLSFNQPLDLSPPPLTNQRVREVVRGWRRVLLVVSVSVVDLEGSKHFERSPRLVTCLTRAVCEMFTRETVTVSISLTVEVRAFPQTAVSNLCEGYEVTKKLNGDDKEILGRISVVLHKKHLLLSRGYYYLH